MSQSGPARPSPPIVLAEGAIHSNAHNYLSFLSTGVDPRTGSFRSGLSLPLPPSGDLGGPGYSLSVAFSPLLTLNQGLGYGWAPAATQWDADRMYLTLASGERYSGHSSDDDPNLIFFPDLKLPAFSLRYEPASSSYVLYHRDGRSERLAQEGSYWVTTALYSPEGRALHYSWEVGNGIARLLSVHEDTAEGQQRGLLAIDYSTTEPAFILRPDDPDAVRLVLALESGAVSDEVRQLRIETRTADNADWQAEAAWELTYRLSEQGLLLVETVNLPTGGTETVIYDDECLALPAGAPFSHLPAAVRFTREPGNGTPALVTGYAYDVGEGPANCYGFGRVEGWNEGVDNLFLLSPPGDEANDYRYGSVETVYDGEDNPLSTTTRIFNRYHLLLRESTDVAYDNPDIPGEVGCRRETVTRYHDVLDLWWDQQPPICQLPSTQTTRVAWLDRNGEETRSRASATLYGFDDEGNLLRQWEESPLPAYSSEGALLPWDLWTAAWRLTEREYYQAAGEISEAGELLCPPDPLGMIRHLKVETVWPAGQKQPDGNGRPTNVPDRLRAKADGAPVLRTRYTYTALPALSGCPVDGSVYGSQEILYEVLQEGTPQEEEREVTRVDDVQVNALNDDRTVQTPVLLRHHGRPLSQSNTTAGLTTTTVHAWSVTSIGGDEAVRDARGRVYTALLEILTVIGHDGTTFTHSAARALHSGDVIEEIDAVGCSTRRAYDPLGRLMQEITAAGTQKAATVSHSWRRDVASGRLIRLLTDVTGQSVEEHLDGLGRPFLKGMTPPDGRSETSLTVWQMDYDAQGRADAERVTDREVNLLHEDKPERGELTLLSVTEYDGWGLPCAVTGPDGVASRTRRDPVEMTEESWREGKAADGVMVEGGRTLTRADAADRPLEVLRLRAKGAAPEMYRQFRYDSVGRMLEETDGDGTLTGYEYDALDRVVRKVLPDSDVILTSYAAGFTGALASELRIEHTDAGGKITVKEVGTREYDGIGRLGVERCGGRVTRLEYEGGFAHPARTVHPVGTVSHTTYDPLLQTVPLTQSAGIEGQSAGEPAWKWDYHPQTGSPLAGHCPLGSMGWTRRRDGMPVEESIDYDDGAFRYTSVNSWSDGGWLNQRSSGGVVTLYAADAAGRPIWMRADDTVTKLFYDALGRLTGANTVHGRQTSQTTLTYDQYGREECRTLTLTVDGQSITQTFTLTWTPGDALAKKVTEINGRVRAETYVCDKRGRLTAHDITVATGDEDLLPLDEHGKHYSGQRYESDGLDNLLSVTTVYPAGTEQPFVRRYHYESVTDVFQLTRVTPGWDGAAEWMPTWDAGGRLTQDERGRKLTYDAFGRLAAVGGQHYGYDPMFRAGREETGGAVRYRMYWEDAMEAEGENDDMVHLSRLPGGGVAELRVAGEVGEVLLSGADAQGSAVAESTEHGGRLLGYDAWGADDGEPGAGKSGYAGMAREDGGYLPGSYRWYSPALRRFSAPDSASPFGAGGINPYAYAGNNPVLHNDTDGHAWWNWMIVGVSVALGAVATVASFGALAPVVAAGLTAMTASQALALTAATLGAVSLGAQVASEVLNATGNEKAGGILGWVSLGTGVASMAASVASTGMRIGNAAGRLRSSGPLTKTPGEKTATLYVFEKEGRVGHASLKIGNESVSPVHNLMSGGKSDIFKGYISFGPNSTLRKPPLGMYMNRVGKFSSQVEDTAAYLRPGKKWTLTVAKFEDIDTNAMADFLQKAKDQGRPFNLAQRNCTDLVSKALSKGYKTPRNVISGLPGKKMVRRPFQLIDFASEHASVWNAYDVGGAASAF